MNIRAFSVYVAVALAATSHAAFSSTNSGQLTVVANGSHVCQRFTAVGIVTPNSSSPALAATEAQYQEMWAQDAAAMQAGTMHAAGPQRVRDATPGATVRFEHLEGIVDVSAAAHVSADCNSPLAGHSLRQHRTHWLRSHLLFNGSTFHEEKL